MSSPGSYHNASQQLVLRLYARLCRCPLASFSLDELLAEEAGCTRDQVFRALHNLAAADFVEQHHRRWRISPRAGALSEQVRRAIAELHHQYLEDPHGNSL